MTRPALLALLAGTFLPGLAAACATLALENAWIREPPPGAGVAAGYGSLLNSGDRTLRVDGVASERFGSAMFHETVHDGDQARMVHRMALEVPAGGRLELAPGGLHMMLMAPVTPPRAGERVALELRCGEASRVFEVPVLREAPAAGP